jgi:hypothetical protein
MGTIPKPYHHGCQKTVPSSEWNVLPPSQTCSNLTNSMVWVRERTIPTERPPLVGEVIANFCG